MNQEEVHNPERSSGRLFSAKWAEAWKELKECVRQQPGPHLLLAFATGYILQIVPFRRLLVLAIKLCLKLERPVLFLFCAFHLYKYISKGAPKNKVDVTVTLEQIQLRAYQIAERRKSCGGVGNETADWAQAERELRAEATGK